MSPQFQAVPVPEAQQALTPMEALEEVGATGLKHTGGLVHEEFLSQLSGMRAVLTYREMRDNDPLVGAILFAFAKLITQVEWRVNPAEDESEKAKEVADFVQECLHDMEQSWPDTIEEALTMLPYGWAFQELVYKKRDGESSKHSDGRIGWEKWAIRSQDSLTRWEIGDGGKILGMWQQCAPNYEPTFIPIEKALLFRTSTSKNNPEGRSILRNAYRPWYFKKRIEEIEATGIERDLVGFPVMYVPPEIMAKDAPSWQKDIYALIQEMIVNLRRDEQEGMIIPMMFDPDTGTQLMKLELLSTGGSRAFDTSAIIERYDRRMAMTVLADFILLGHESVGSFALSSDKTDIFAVTLGSVLRNIRDITQNDAIPRLLKLNGIDQALTPKLEFGDIESQSLTEVITYVQGLVAAGVPLFPDEKLSKYLLGLGNLPEPEHDLDQNVSESGVSPDAAGGPESGAEPNPATQLDPAVAQLLEG